MGAIGEPIREEPIAVPAEPVFDPATTPVPEKTPSEPVKTPDKEPVPA